MTPTGDAVAPTCLLTGTGVTNGQRYLQVTVQDKGSGLGQIVILISTNMSVSVPPYTPGTKLQQAITATKINQAQTAQVSLRVSDLAGNATVCDPFMVDLLIPPSGAPVAETIPSVPAAESQLLLENGTPGIRDLRVQLNGHAFVLTGIGDNEERSLDVSPAMAAGDNTLVVTASGPPGATALLIISDLPSSPDPGGPTATPTRTPIPTRLPTRTPTRTPVFAPTRTPDRPYMTPVVPRPAPGQSAAAPAPLDRSVHVQAPANFTPPPPVPVVSRPTNGSDMPALLPTTGSGEPQTSRLLVDATPETTAGPSQTVTEVLNLALPRYLPSTSFMLVAEALYATDDGELWQARTWFNSDDETSWDSLEDLGPASNLAREVLYVDDGGLLWRTRTWSDAASGTTWMTEEDLGAFSQDQGGGTL